MAARSARSKRRRRFRNSATLDSVRHPHAIWRAQVWELRHNLTAYDATYLVLAEALAEPVLLTGDAALALEATRSLGTERVRHLA